MTAALLVRHKVRLTCMLQAIRDLSPSSSSLALLHWQGGQLSTSKSSRTTARLPSSEHGLKQERKIPDLAQI
jgi:hypothetical protein